MESDKQVYQTTGPRKVKKRKRLTPLGRFVVFVFLCFLSAVIGSLIGYSVIGEGNPIEVFHPQTWIHFIQVIIQSLI
ncbi:MAG TPA: DNA-directed RNA polymerase subunit beta [Chondromyces sp.]|nr:DNA-directed RNA polymerase subunit beta [Chondromyces sp.]